MAEIFHHGGEPTHQSSQDGRHPERSRTQPDSAQTIADELSEIKALEPRASQATAQLRQLIQSLLAQTDRTA